MDPVEFRRLNAVDTGATGVAGQVYDEIGLQECIDAAAGDRLRRRPADDEAIGVAVGWWPSFPGRVGRVRQARRRRQGQIITGAQECGTGAVMTLPQLAADELGMRPTTSSSSTRTPSVAPYDTGATGSQTLLNNGRASMQAAQEIADQLASSRPTARGGAADIVLADGRRHVAGSPDRRSRSPSWRRSPPEASC